MIEINIIKLESNEVVEQFTSTNKICKFWNDKENGLPAIWNRYPGSREVQVSLTVDGKLQYVLERKQTAKGFTMKKVYNYHTATAEAEPTAEDLAKEEATEQVA